MALTKTQIGWLRKKINAPLAGDDFFQQFESNPEIMKAMNAELPYEARYSKLPDEIQYQQAYDPNTMSMEPELQKRLNAIQMDTRGLDKFRGEALRSGESAWSQMAKRGLAMDAQANAENLLRGAQGRAAEARAGMARRGGIGAGSNERLGRASMREGLLAQQGAYRDRTKGMLDIGMADEKNRIGMLGQLPGMEIAAMQPAMEKANMWSKGKQFDITNALGEAQAKNKFAMDMWQKKMDAFGSIQTADAQRAATEGSWLCTEVMRRSGLAEDDKKALAKLLRYGMREHKKLTVFYTRECSPLVEKMAAADYDWATNEKAVRGVIEMVRREDLKGAFAVYQDHVMTLMAKYWPEGYHIMRKRKEAA